MEDKSLEMAETMKSILFWQKVIVALFVVGLVLLAERLPMNQPTGYTSHWECWVREQAKDPSVDFVKHCETLGYPRPLGSAVVN